MRLCVTALQEQKMADKFPNLGGIATAIDKLTHAIEDDAKDILKKIEGVHEKRGRVFDKAKTKIATRTAALESAEAALDQLDAALGDNGGPPLPTSDGSAGPSHDERTAPPGAPKS